MDPTLFESVGEVVQTGVVVATLGVGVVMSFFTKGYIDINKTMQAADMAIKRVTILVSSGHIDNIKDAVCEAIGIVKDVRKRKKLSEKSLHKIEERVKNELGHLLDEKTEPKHAKK